MRGHIRHKKSGGWEIITEIGRDPKTGKRKQHSETVRGTKREAEHRLAELINQIEGKAFLKPERITFGQWLTKWCDSQVDSNTSTRTASSYRDEIERHIKPNLGQVLLSQLTPLHLQDYYAHASSHGRLDGSFLTQPGTLPPPH